MSPFFNISSTRTSPVYFQYVNVTLKLLRHSHLNKSVFSYLNTNSIKNMFDDLDKIVEDNIDMLDISETKIDEYFLTNQFILEGHHAPYRLHITAKIDSLMVFVKSYIPSRRITEFNIPSNKLIIAFKVNLRKEM